MKRYSSFVTLVLLVWLMPISLLSAQQTPEAPIQTLRLGDTVTGTLARSERRRYTLKIDDADGPIDIVLLSRGNSVLYVYYEKGEAVLDQIGEYGNEVFTWKLGNKKPVQIGVGGTTEDYVLSILPSETQISEEPRPGEEVKRWAALEVGKAETKRAVTLPYLLYVPEGYDKRQVYPFILFLHGSGEAGPRLDFLKAQVLPKLIEDGQDYPFIIASPHLTYREDWQSKTDVLATFIAQLQAEFPIDPHRIYVTGLSLGGAGVWHFALAYPDLPAAVVSMAGFYSYGSLLVPKNICDLAGTPMRVFHGNQDEVVPLAWEKGLVEALKECGGNVKFTVYPDADHSQTFEQGFADPALYTWLLEQHK